MEKVYIISYEEYTNYGIESGIHSIYADEEMAKSTFKNLSEQAEIKDLDLEFYYSKHKVIQKEWN